jgi:GT2 family glycosyltransferase
VTKQFSIYGVFITYANRAHLLEKAVKSAYRAGIGNVIIVDNNSEPESQKIMKDMKDSYGNKLEIIHLSQNKGSAGGFKVGLQAVSRKKDCDFIWLLDDDCVPLKNSLKELLKFWEKHEFEDKENKMALMSMRFSLPNYLYKTEKELKLEALEKELLNLNAFCFFSLERAFSLLFHKSDKKRKKHNYSYVQTVISPYGSLFFNKKLLKRVGLPREEFFQYFDDTEFTYRMYKNYEVRFFLIPKSKIKDIDVTFKNAYIRTYFSIFKIMGNINSVSDRRLYYEYRNRIIFEKQYLITNKFKYQANKLLALYLIYPLFSVMYSLIYKDHKMQVLRKAIQDGTNIKFK